MLCKDLFIHLKKNGGEMSGETLNVSLFQRRFRLLYLYNIGLLWNYMNKVEFDFI